MSVRDGGLSHLTSTLDGSEIGEPQSKSGFERLWKHGGMRTDSMLWQSQPGGKWKYRIWLGKNRLGSSPR